MITAVRLKFSLLDINPVADQFSVDGGVLQYLLAEAHALKLVGFCWRTIGQCILGVAEGNLDDVLAFHKKCVA